MFWIVVIGVFIFELYEFCFFFKPDLFLQYHDFTDTMMRYLDV